MKELIKQDKLTNANKYMEKYEIDSLMHLDGVLNGQ